MCYNRIRLKLLAYILVMGSGIYMPMPMMMCTLVPVILGSGVCSRGVLGLLAIGG